MNYKIIKDKGIKLLGAVSIAFVSIVGTAPISTHALAPVSGDAILAQAKTYETNGWTYDSVGTCTGLVTRTLEALGVGSSIVGTMQGNMAKYNPTQMVDNAESHPTDAKLIWKGRVQDIALARDILKNGDLILQYPGDTVPNNGFGHAAFIEKVGGNIYAYGANNPTIGIGRLILLSASRGMETTVNLQNYIRVYRLAEEIKPIYQLINATKTASEDITVALTKTDVDSGKALEGVTFDFYRDNVKFGTTTTNSNGVASLLSSNNFSATSDNFTYAINYADLDANGRQEVANAGAYSNASEAQAAADAQAQAKANALANVSHTFKVVETATKAQYWLNPDNTTASNNQAGSGSVNLTLQNKRTVGTANLTKVDKDTSGAAQGTASLDGAVYGLYARENILDPADGSILTTKDSLIQQVTTVAAKASVSNLYLGEYYWKEITPSLGYQLDDTKYNVSISYANQATSTVVKDTTVQESIFTGEFEITKVIADDESGIATPEEGAEFIAVAKKYVDQYGGVEEAYTHKADFSAKEYELLRTNADGIAKSGKLAWGPYVVKQTKAAIDTDIMKDTFEFQVNSINQTLKKYIISNTPYKAYLKL
ncbi:MAG: prealbumin-like fold domain-containing protein, partial [Erysipelotrichaceae bacterium]